MRERFCRIGTALAIALALTTGATAQEPGPPPAGAKPAAVVNLNAASVEQLATLPGIGERTAQRIVEYRQKNGPFKKTEDLMNVKGIGEKSFLRLKGLLSVGAAKTDRPATQSL